MQSIMIPVNNRLDVTVYVCQLLSVSVRLVNNSNKHIQIVKIKNNYVNKSTGAKDEIIMYL